MRLPLSYSFRNLWTRKLTTILTATGMALVVFVFAAVLMLAEGLRKTLVETGSPDNVVVVRRSADSEVVSIVQRSEAAIIETQPEIAQDTEGKPLAAREVMVLMALPKTGTTATGNVPIRGITEISLRLRPQVKLVSGRILKPGTSEILIGGSIAKRFKGTGLGQTLRFGVRDWQIVGIFDAGRTGFDSEIWADGDQLMNTFRRPVYSSLILKLRDPVRVRQPQATARIQPPTDGGGQEGNPVLRRPVGDHGAIHSHSGPVHDHHLFHGGHDRRHGDHVRRRGQPHHRDRNPPGHWIFSERAFWGLSCWKPCSWGRWEGDLGLLAASGMQWVTISTINWQTFSELAFSFVLNGRSPWKPSALP